ncbi:helicase-related protein [Geminisphaera colitermitum]|uniref:helicase-related protein n=1 Tax=Geminisphaera colitermitum TaxID=1148786 RepID=UPI00019652E2|nr:helicase-related protein [Geminisphaera colitermitum]
MSIPCQHISSGIRDNHRRGSVGDFLRAELRAGADLDIVTAYFTVFAYDKLQPQLDNLGRIRLLFGEAAFIHNLDPEHKDGAAYVLRDDGLALASGLNQRHIAQACAAWIRDKVEVRSVTRTGFLHGKMSHIRRGEVSAAIIGSSNFTTRGLGLGTTNNNVELNLVVDGNRDRADLQQWFEELWNDTSRVEDVKQAVLDYLLQVYRDQSPEFIYFKTLFELFRRFIDEGRDIEDNLKRIRLPETGIWNSLFAFQKDGAKSAINKLKTYGGCILADSVGLGKTYEALAVIKYFELRNEKVLVLCPNKLRSNWDLYPAYVANKHNPFAADRFGYTVLAHTDLSREGGASGAVQELRDFHWGAFDLVVIDESHNFRNNALGKPREDGAERRSRYQRLMQDIIQSGVRTKVLLLSATPVNNTLADLRNQLSFIAGGDVARDTPEGLAADTFFSGNLEIPSLKATTREAQKRFTEWSKKPPEQRQKKDLIHVLGGDFLKLLDAITIARSRRHISRHYQSEMVRLGGFPVRTPPLSVYPEIDTAGKFPTYDVIADRLAEYKLWIFRPAEHLRADLPPATVEHYTRRIGGFTQQGRERILTHMMRITLLKRLESSIDSFRRSLAATLEKIDRLEQRMAVFETHRDANPDLDFEVLAPEDVEDDDPELAAALEIGRRVTFKMAHLDLDAWRAHLAEDRRQLNGLLGLARPVTPERDAKLAELRSRLAAKIQNPPLDKDGHLNRKVLVFTAYADTARYLYDNLHRWLRKDLGVHASLVVGSGQNASTLTPGSDYTAILTDFAPRAKRRSGDLAAPQVDVLIASDCISEGQNLQDCDTVINYDIHWNPVRIIQRFGRVDRIGSRATAVHLINFWPTAHLDRYINLKQRVEARMALVDLTATQTDNPLDEKQLEDLVTTDLRLRDRQLERMRKEILDLEDLEDSVTLADFSLDDFRADLLRFLERNREQLEKAPLGLYAVVPALADIPLTAGGGVIFCLRQKGNPTARPATETEKINPLAPHYLVYVRADGEVRLAYTQVKTILNLFRELALGKTEPYAELCRLFDRATANGSDMGHQSRLIRSAVESITATFQQKLAAGLQHSRQFILPVAEAQPHDDEAGFELVTWLVLHPSAGQASTT